MHTGPHTFTSRADAARYLATVEADLHRGTWADPKLGRITLADWARRWQATTTNLRPTTRDLYAYLLRWFLLPTFGKAAPEQYRCDGRPILAGEPPSPGRKRQHSG